MANLPAGYKELEYIESTGTQWIDCGVKPTAECRLLCKFQKTGGTSFTALFGTRDTNSATSANQFNFWMTGEGAFRTDYFGQNQAIYVPDSSKEFELDKNKQYTYLDGVMQSGLQLSSGVCSHNLALFAYNGAGSVVGQSSWRLWYLKIYNADELEKDFVPCKNSSGVVGLYDLVSGSFFGNSGTGSFIAGPEVTNTLEKPNNVSYFVSNGVITFSWDSVEGAIGYRIYKNGFLISEQSEPLFSSEAVLFEYENYAVSAYNETGEGERASINIYVAPENPIPYLITDRTAQDVTNGTEKGSYNTSDLNRVTACMEYINAALKNMGYESGYTPVKIERQCRLPIGYTELEYIESTGTQYIDPDIVLSPENFNSFKIECDLKFRFKSEANGVGTSSASNNYLYFGTYSGGIYIGNGLSDVYANAIYDGERHIWTLDVSSQHFSVDDIVSITNVSFQKVSSYSNFLIPAWGSGIVIWNFKYFQDGKEEKNLIPCKHSSGVVGLYDLVSGLFFGNAGTGSFIAGPEVVRSDLLDPYIWYKTDVPTDSQLRQYLDNVQKIRQVLSEIPNNPNSPETANGLTFSKANDIEKILLNIGNMVENMQRTINLGWALGIADIGLYGGV